MANLLPKKEKKLISTEYLFRLSIVFFSFLFFSIVAAGVFLVPSFFALKTKESSIIMQTDLLKNFTKSGDRANIEKYLAETKEKLELLQKEETSYSIKTLFSEIIKNRPEGLRIQNISYSLGDEKESPYIILRGRADKREKLLAFYNVIKELSDFSSVDLPISNLTKDVNADFSMKLIVNKIINKNAKPN